MRENPLLDIADNPSRLFVGVLEDPSESGRLCPLTERDWSREAIAVGTSAAFLWYPGGFMESLLREAFDRLMGDRVTTRSWATIQKVQGPPST